MTRRLPLGKEAIIAIQKTFDEQGYLDALEDALHAMEEVAQNSYVQPIFMAWLYLDLNNPEKAMEWLEKGYEMHDPVIPYAFTGIAHYDLLEGNPRFINLLNKMNFPLKEN